MNTGKGITADASISTLIAALYLLPLDRAMYELASSGKIFYVRYMNDIIILGKTHLAVALAVKACSKGYSVLFSPAVDIINTLSAAAVVNSLDRVLKKYTLPKVIVIDELGYLPIDKQGANLLFQVISKRYETGSIILTDNRAFKDWPKVFNNDSTVISAVLDRLLHHSESYRY